MKTLFLFLSLFLSMMVFATTDSNQKEIRVKDIYTDSGNGEDIFTRSIIPTVQVTLDDAIMEMTLLFSHNVGNVTVRISDAHGTVCLYKNMATVMKTCPLNLMSLNKGDYTIEIEDENARHHWIGVFQL